jgi:hypothetical protein
MMEYEYMEMNAHILDASCRAAGDVWLCSLCAVDECPRTQLRRKFYFLERYVRVGV